MIFFLTVGLDFVVGHTLRCKGDMQIADIGAFCQLRDSERRVLSYLLNFRARVHNNFS